MYTRVKGCSLHGHVYHDFWQMIGIETVEEIIDENYKEK